MDYWYSLNLGDAIMAAGPTAELETAFKKTFAEAGSPREMAVFTRLESEGRLHCEAIAYFSPAAGEVAQAFLAQPCPKPNRAGLGLLAGSPEAWSLLFPGELNVFSRQA